MFNSIYTRVTLNINYPGTAISYQVYKNTARCLITSPYHIEKNFPPMSCLYNIYMNFKTYTLYSASNTY